MKAIGVLWLFLFSLSAYGSSDGTRIRFGADFKGEGAEVKRMTGEYFIQEGAVRFENTIASAPEQSTVMIGTAKPKKVVVLFPARKSYMEIPQNPTRPPAEAARQSIPFKPTGKTKNIAGYPCNVVERDLKDQREEACTSPKLKQELKNLEEIFPRAGTGRSGMPVGLDGFALEYQIFNKVGGRVGATPEMWLKAEKLTREKFQAALFEVPADYTREEQQLMDQKALEEMMKRSGKGAQQDPKGFEERMKEMQKMMEEMKKGKKKPE